MKGITGIILAGGKASRMNGFPKGLILVNGKYFIQKIKDTLNNFCDEVILIANDDIYKSVKIPIYKDLIKNKGPLAGIYTGLHYSKTEHNIIVACDLPFISRGIVSKIINNVSSENLCVVPVVGDRVQPLCAYYSKKSINIIKKLLDEENLILKEAIKELSPKYIKFKRTYHWLNINTMKDLKNGIRVLFFSSIAEEIGINTLIVENVKNIEELLKFLYTKYPFLRRRRFRIAVNKEIVSTDRNLISGDEVAILPPFSGG